MTPGPQLQKVQLRILRRGAGRHIVALKKRRDWLRARTLMADADLSYDKQEIAALDWAIGELEHKFPMLRELEYKG